MERKTDIIQNVMPRFDLFPHLTATARFLGAFVLNRHEIPPTGAEQLLADLNELDAEERMRGYWGELATPETPVPFNRYPGAVGGCVALPSVEVTEVPEL